MSAANGTVHGRGSRTPAAVPQAFDNPYLREFTRLQAELARASSALARVPGASSVSADDRRAWCVRRYAFAVPTDEALTTLARWAPIVELGAGTGYWCHLLRLRGVDCVAYDRAPPDRADNPHRFQRYTWTHVEPGDIDVLARYADRALFLCWPPYRDAFAARAVQAFAGNTLLYIGEPRGGHTADETFFDLLGHDWQLIEQVALPNWPGTRDALTVYRRRASPTLRPG